MLQWSLLQLTPSFAEYISRKAAKRKEDAKIFRLGNYIRGWITENKKPPGGNQGAFSNQNH